MAEPVPGSAADLGDQAPRQPLPRSLDDLRAALAAGQREFIGLSLADLDGVDLDLAGCNLRDGCFLEARFGHARFTGADLVGCGFQRALLWGADLSMVRARGSLWQEADLSGSRLRGADLSFAQFNGANLRLVCLREADLRGCDLRHALIDSARLEAARLEGARLPEI